MAMNKLLYQTLSQPQSMPGTPNSAQFLFSTKATPEALNHSSGTSQHYPSSTSLLSSSTQNYSTAGKIGVTVPSTERVPLSTTVSQIPTSLQRLVQANLSASSSNVHYQPSFTQSSLKRCSSTISSSTSPQSNTTRPNFRPVPIPITSTSVVNPCDEVGPTPLTPLSPYCGQQGVIFSCAHISCLLIGTSRWHLFFFQFE